MHYNQPRIVSTQAKLTQKVDHFIVLRPSLALVAAYRGSREITWKKMAGWTCEVVRIKNVFIGWVVGDGLAGKGYSSKLW